MFSIPWLAGLVVAVLALTLIELGALSLVFAKLGLSAGSAAWLLLASLLGSAINVPLLSLSTGRERLVPEPEFADFTLPPYKGRTILAINLGGGLTPAVFCGYLLSRQSLPLVHLGLGVVLIALLCHLLSRSSHRPSIGLPILFAPPLAALFAILIVPQHSAAVAYLCGTLGMLIGADLLRLPHVVRQRVPRAAIGGAGSFDGVFVSGIIAALLT